jgi:MFS family permease
MIGCALAAGTGSAIVVLITFTVAAFFATCAWVSAYPTFSELFPTRLRATGIGASVAVGRMGAIIGQVVLAITATTWGVGVMFGILGLFWLIGALAGTIWWKFGTEARGVSLEELAAVKVLA